MQRTLEPEIMADAEQSLAYANADFASSNQLFVDHLLADNRRPCTMSSTSAVAPAT